MSQFSNNFRKVPIVTTVLIIINVAVYVVLPLLPGGNALYRQGVLTPYDVMVGNWWTLITSMFLHSSLNHIICNMFSLYYLGVMCERVFGPVKYLILYMVSGLAGGLLFVAVNIASGSYLSGAVGASGAIFGLFGAMGWLLFKNRKRIDKGSIQSYFVMLAINLFIGFMPGSNIANAAHIGGMICGFLLGAVFLSLGGKKRINNRQ